MCRGAEMIHSPPPQRTPDLGGVAGGQHSCWRWLGVGTAGPSPGTGAGSTQCAVRPPSGPTSSAGGRLTEGAILGRFAPAIRRP